MARCLLRRFACAVSLKVSFGLDLEVLLEPASPGAESIYTSARSADSALVDTLTPPRKSQIDLYMARTPEEGPHIYGRPRDL